MAVIELTPARLGVQVQAPPQARGGVALGRAAAVDPVATAVGELGQTFGVLEERTRQARNQREVMTAGAEYAEGLAELRGRAERNDPEFAADPVAAFRSGAEALRARISERFGDGEARSLFEARARVAAAGETPAMITFATRREAERTQAALTDTLGTLARGAAAENDPSLRNARIAQADEAINGALGTGGISEVQAQRLRQTFRGGLDQAEALRLINRNPGEAVRALSDPSRFANLDDVQRERLFGTATSAASAAAARAEAATARRERRVMLEVQQVNGLLQSGIVPEDRVGRLLDAARGTDLEPQVRQMVADGRQVASFMLASDEEQRRQLADADARRRGPNATDADQAHFARLAQAQAQQRAAYQQDGLGRAVAEGLVPPQPPIDWSDPASLNGRVDAAMGVSARRGYAISPFNREDLAAGVAEWTRAPPERRAQMVRAMVEISDPAIRAEAFRTFERARGDSGNTPDGTLARIGSMLATGRVEDAQAAMRLLGNFATPAEGRVRQAGESQEMNAALIDARRTGVFGTHVAAAAALGNGSGHAHLVVREERAIQQAAAARMAAGESSATRAVEAAQRDWESGRAYINQDGFAHVYFPASAGTPAQVAAGLRLLRDQAAAEVRTDPALGADQALAGRARQEAARRAVWINEGATFALVARGQAGAPVVLRTATLAEIVGAADARAATEAREPPPRPDVTAPTGGGATRTPAATLPSQRGRAPTLQ